MEDDVNQGGVGGGDERVNGAAGGHPPPPAPPTGGARPKQPAPRPPPLADDSDDEPSPPASLSTPRRTNGRPDHRLLLSHSASESDCALDECVYTYKGDRPADVNRNHSRPAPPPADGRVSPDLDFLEMDFDPSAFDTSDEELEAAAGWVAAGGADALLAVAAVAAVTASPPPPLEDVPPPLESPSRLEPVRVADADADADASSSSPSPPSPAGSRASSRFSGSSRSRSPSPLSSRGSSPGAAAAPPAENVKFNRLSAAGSNSDDNLRCNDGGSPENNAADGRLPGRRPAEHKVTNRRMARYNLGSCSAPAAPPPPERAARLPHSRSEDSAVGGGSDKYRHCCSNDLSDRQPGGCRERLRRRENSVFNIPGAGDPNLQNDGCHVVPEKAFMARKGAADAADAGLFELGCDPAEKVMIWTEMEAFTRQVTQIGRSACGATAVINVLLALGYQPDPAAAAAAVSTRLRRETAPLADYLFSRAEAGCTHKQLIDGVETLSGGQVCGRFFSMHPRRSFQLVRWLGGWLRRGAVPVATLNLQRGVSPQQTVPDAWHHQMAFGVGPQGVYLTNPLECVSASLLGEQLSSDSVLLVRREDVTTRWRDGCSLHPLMAAADSRWRHTNVLGQVVNVLREASDPPPPGVRRALTSHVTLPAWYRSGVTLFVRRSSPHCADLLREPELPRLEDC